MAKMFETFFDDCTISGSWLYYKGVQLAYFNTTGPANQYIGTYDDALKGVALHMDLLGSTADNDRNECTLNPYARWGLTNKFGYEAHLKFADNFSLDDPAGWEIYGESNEWVNSETTDFKIGTAMERWGADEVDRVHARVNGRIQYRAAGRVDPWVQLFREYREVPVSVFRNWFTIKVYVEFSTSQTGLCYVNLESPEGTWKWRFDNVQTTGGFKLRPSWSVVKVYGGFAPKVLRCDYLAVYDSPEFLEGPVPFTCQCCPATFSSQADLDNHKATDPIHQCASGYTYNWTSCQCETTPPPPKTYAARVPMMPTLALAALKKLRDRFIRKEVHKKLHPVI